MNVLIVGAGASRATNRLPTALSALGAWERNIRERYRLLAFALQTWIGDQWPATDLETAWRIIDLAWNERAAGAADFAVRDLTHGERRQVWQQAFHVAGAEPMEPAYYRPQIEWARDLGHSTEQFLSVVAGWELRRLIQETFVVNASGEGRRLYGQLLEGFRPDAVISFNYDTIVEQCLPNNTWTYNASEVDTTRLVVLKPHGSVNWTHHHPRIAEAGERIEVDMTLRPEAMGYRANWLAQNAVIGLRTKIEHTAAESSPAIRTLFREVLKRGEEVLGTAERICIVGYRFAPADAGFLDMLARAVARRQGPPEIGVIGHGNPEDVLPNIRDLFAVPAGQPLDHCFHGFEPWVAHGFCNSWS